MRQELLLLMMLSGCCAALNAQASKPETGSNAASLASLIQALKGNWHLKVHLAPMGASEKAIDGEGEESWSAGPGNITLIEKEHTPMPGGYADLLGLVWWDNKAKRFGGMECYSEMPITCDPKAAVNDITVSWDGRKLEIEMKETHGDKHYVLHESWMNITADGFDQIGDLTMDDGSTLRFMTVHATRVEKLNAF